MQTIQDTCACPVTITANFIGGKWKPLLLALLFKKGPLRFGKLQFLVPAISNKILTRQLRELEGDLLITREVLQESPQQVAYSLSSLGATLIPVLNAMFDWGKDYNPAATAVSYGDQERLISL